jgi:hypothetical protein
MYESRAEAPLPLGRFALRMLAHGGGVGLLVAVSLAIGMAGYHAFERLSWLDAFLNAAMLLGGMGPVDSPATSAGKLFAGLYALYCGLVVIVATGAFLVPVLHRAIHLFHWRRDHPK